MTLTDRLARAALAISLAGLIVTGCSPSGAANQPEKAVAPAAATPRKAAIAAPKAPVAAPASGVMSKTDFVKSGKPACNILFRYAGHEPETLFWKEPCKAVTTRMLDRQQLQHAGKWERLNDFDRTFVVALPHGRVLYVGGSFTAAIYPIGTNGLTYELSVAD